MRILALDVGTKRVGLAFADTAVKIAVPRGMVPADEKVFAAILPKMKVKNQKFSSRTNPILPSQPRNFCIQIARIAKKVKSTKRRRRLSCKIFSSARI